MAEELYSPDPLMIEESLEDTRKKSPVNGKLDAAITQEELDRCITKMKRGKAAGPDKITSDWVKDLDATNRRKLLGLINGWWQQKKWWS